MESIKQTDGIPSPAITFSVPKQIMEHSCFDRDESTAECLEKACLKQTEVTLVAGAWTERQKMYHGGSFLKLADDNMDIQNPEAQNRDISGF